jgi:subfamily B ATP-binding cassette protein MsbA
MVGQFTNIIQHASASAERILEVIREPQVIQSGRDDLPSGLGEVKFDQVSFKYYDGKASLADVTFEVPPGHTARAVWHPIIP